jgi:hypothetical protein
MRLTRCLFVVAALVAISASPASAAFPGRDGLLAVQPVTGAGIVLVNTHGGAERRICTSHSRCGSPRNPRWSPDGRALAYQASRVHLINPDGSCLNCQLGGAGTPTFTANPTLVTFESQGALLEDAIDGIRKATILKGNASDAVWSAGGQLALVRGGNVWVGTPKHLRRLGAGSAPSWSPSGAQVAIVRKGWVLVVSVHSHAARRLVRGGAPAWSPDGRSIAFIGPGHELRIIPAAGGHARRVGHVRGDTVDWQPVPRRPVAPCTPPPGAMVLARSAIAVVTGDDNSNRTAAMGCLLANGEAHLLELFSDGEDGATYVGPAALGGDYAAVVNDSTDPHYGEAKDAVAMFDVRTGAPLSNRGGESIDCSAESCNIGIDQVVVGSDGVSAAHTFSTLPPGSESSPLTSVSCPSTSLCVATDGGSHTFTSTDPAADPGAWVSSEGTSPQYISCPSTLLCVGVGGETISTADPAAGTVTWTAAYTDAGEGHSLTGISCPTVTLCVAVDLAGNVLTSTDPTGGPSAWSLADIDGTHILAGVSCPSASLCVATDYSGQAITSTDPTGGSGAWQAYPAAPDPGALSVTCASATLCFGIGFNGQAFTSTDPTGGTPWTQVSEPVAPTAIDCPSASFCAAVSNQGTVQTSTDPTSGAWTSTEIDENPLRSIFCASASLCVAGDTVGYLVASSDPTGGSAAWTSAFVDGNPCTDGMSCTTEQIVSSDATGVHTLDTVTAPGMGPLLTGLSLTGDTLTWEHAGTPETATLAP